MTDASLLSDSVCELHKSEKINSLTKPFDSWNSIAVLLIFNLKDNPRYFHLVPFIYQCNLITCLVMREGRYEYPASDSS